MNRQLSPSEFDSIKKIKILEDLNTSELEKVLERTRRIEAPAGTVIMAEGNIGDTMYFFIKGVVDISKSLTLKIAKKGYENVEKSVVKLDANIVSLFGEMAMIDASPRSANVTADTDCILLEITKNDFEEICSLDPEIGLKMLRRISQMLSHNVRRGNEDIMKLTTALSIALSQ